MGDYRCDQFLRAEGLQVAPQQHCLCLVIGGCVILAEVQSGECGTGSPSLQTVLFITPVEYLKRMSIPRRGLKTSLC